MSKTRFSASNAARLIACPGSADLSKSIPGWTPPVEDPTKFTAKGVGTVVHDLLYHAGQMRGAALRDYRDAAEYVATLHHTKRKDLIKDERNCEILLARMAVTYNQVSNDQYKREFVTWIQAISALTPKMIRFIRYCLEEMSILKDQLSYSSRVKFLYEKEMPVNWLQQESVKTTVDFVSHADDGVMDVWDYKTGSIPVEAADNDQLMYYAYTAAEYLRVQPEQIRLRILQPGNNNQHVVSWEELLDWKERALQAESQILAGVTSLRPSDHCTFCPANPHARGEKGYPLCPAQREMLYPERIDYGELLS